MEELQYHEQRDLKNKKKLQFENDLEKQINEEGVRKKYVKIY